MDVLLNRASRMDKIRILTRMVREIPHGASAYSPMVATKRASTAVYAVATDGCSDNDSSNHYYANGSPSDAHSVSNSSRSHI